MKSRNTTALLKIVFTLFILLFLASCRGSDSESTPIPESATPTPALDLTRLPAAALPPIKGDGCPGTWEGARVEGLSGSKADLILILPQSAQAPEGWSTCGTYEYDPAYRWYRISVEITAESADKIRSDRRYPRPSEIIAGVPEEALWSFMFGVVKTWTEYQSLLDVDPSVVKLTCFCSGEGCCASNQE